MKLRQLAWRIVASLCCVWLCVGAVALAQSPTPPAPPAPGSMTLEQTLSDGAQRNTIAFDALAFLTGSLGADSFFPPGKVADFWGFQFLRDNDPSGMGHNTDFLTRAALNMLQTLTSAQRAELIALAQSQVSAINQYGYDRFVLMAAFRRLLSGEAPAGSAGLDLAAVQAYSAQLYRLDGVISYQRAQVMGTLISQLTTSQRAYLDAMVGKGMLTWPVVAEPEDMRGLDRDVKVAVMTYAGDMFSWYAGSIQADVYFCPERQGTYFGSFYMKDAPAVGNPGYSIPVTMTAEMGETFLQALTTQQGSVITELVAAQKPALYAIVDRRTEVSTLLRGFMAGTTPDQAQVLGLMEAYGRLDGEIIYRYATAFAQVNGGLTEAQRTQLTGLRTLILGNLSQPSGAYLYSQAISMPTIPSSDFLFAGAGTPVPTSTHTVTPTSTSTPAATSTPTRKPSSTPTPAPTVTITRIMPAVANQGQRSVLVAITLSSAQGLPSQAPSSVKIGGLAGRSVTRSGTAIRAVFDFPASEPAGRKDVTVTFNTQGGKTTITQAGGFEVRSNSQPPTPTRPAGRP